MSQASRDSDFLVQFDDAERRKYQLFLLSIYKDIKRVCDKYSLKLFVIGGTALGAVRHHGFIPWDDDFDMGMLREDYEVFRSIFAKELSDRYILNAPNYSKYPAKGYARIFKKGTYFKDIIDNISSEMHHICIDLFVLDNVPENAVARSVKGMWCDFSFRVARCVYIWENRTDEVKQFFSAAGKTNYYLRTAVGITFSFFNSARWYSIADNSANYRRDSKLCGIPTGRKRYAGEIMVKEDVLPGAIFPFEDEQVLIFSNYDPYLRNLYGNYMELPPVEERERHAFCKVSYTSEEG